MLGKDVTIKESIQYVISFIQQHQKDIQKNILNGLGELIDEKYKNDIKNKLVIETLQELQFYIDNK